MEELGDIPREVGSYRIVGVIGAGAMGVVLRAEHALIGRPAAVKLLKPDSSRNRDIVARFFNEARAATAIKHPGIVEIYDFGYLPSGSAYLVMELLEGVSLESRISARGRLTEAEAFGVVRGLATALAAAHAKGIVHRDIKPDNIYLVPDPEQPTRERVKILDFGIAKLTAELGVDGKATRTGAVMGTPCYMAPEQCRGAGHVDHRADLYAVGCVLMHLLTGAPPFPDMGVGETIGAHLFIAPPTVRSRVPDASDMAESLVASLLAKHPDQRIQSALELVERLASAGATSSLVVSGSVWVAPGAPGAGQAATTTLGAATRGSVQLDGPRKRRWPIIAGTATLAAVVVVAAIAAGSGGGATKTAGAGSSSGSGSAAGSTELAGGPATVTATAGSGAAPALIVDAGVAAVPVAPVPGDAGVAAAAPIDAAASAGAAPSVDAGMQLRKPVRRPTTRKPEDLLKGL